jgi:hypothetical protein
MPGFFHDQIGLTETAALDEKRRFAGAKKGGFFSR